MTFMLAAIFFCLLVISPVAALIFALALLILCILILVSQHRVRTLVRDAEAAVLLDEELERLEASSADLPTPVITGRDHPLASFGRVPGADR